MDHAVANCFWLLRQLVWMAFCLALSSTGTNIAAKMAIIAITTSSSIKVKPLRLDFIFILAFLIVFNLTHSEKSQNDFSGYVISRSNRPGESLTFKRDQPLSGLIRFHYLQHLPDSIFHSCKYRTAHNAMANVQFVQIGYGKERRQILVV